MADTLYSVTALDKPDSTDKRAGLRHEHLRWIETLGETLMMGGPLRENEDGPVVGSHLIVRTSSKAALRELLADDPYAKGSLFASVSIVHFQPVAGAWLTS